jgi:cellobiose phosphorylase
MSDGLFPGKYGYFAPDGESYIITEPRTPRPWCNVISNGDYGLMVSQTGGGYSWLGNAGQNRITRASQDLIKDNWGKYVYLRDTESGEYFSLAWKPVMAPYESYRAVHGIGWTRFEQRCLGLETELTVFIHPETPVEYMEVTVQNRSGRPRELDLTTYFEWILGMYPDEHREFHKIFMDTRGQDGTVAVTKYLWGFPDDKGRWNNVSWPYWAFHACSAPVDSFDTDKESFIGMYGDESAPAAMKAPSLAGRQGRFGDAAAALRTAFTLNDGESKTVVFTIGVVPYEEDPFKAAAGHTTIQACRAAREGVDNFWAFLKNEHVSTPDPAFDLMVNKWLKYQAISCRLWGKSAYYQVSAGWGFRDQLQDSQIFLPLRPELTKKQLLLHAENQFSEGDVYHWWFTIRGGGPRTKCSDDLLWMPFILDAYLKETGDYAILDERRPYCNGGEDDLYGHCKRAIELSLTRLSPRGVPLMGDHDWNDGLSAVGNEMRGESFWMSEFLYCVLRGFIPLAERRGETEFAKQMEEVCVSLKITLNSHGWDGKWYLQATTDAGKPVGSARNDEGQIFLNPQLWAVISGMSIGERAKTCMNNVTKYLLREYGALLLEPAYTKVRTDIGYITRYAPGLRENGGVYTHAAAWAVWAYALMGDADNAYEAFKRICPPNRHADADGYMCEPYVTPGNSDGPLSPMFGRGGWTWYTGSAQWLHRVGTNWILGVRAGEDGLTVDPCIPAQWDGFSITRRYRGAVYHITVKNPRHVSSGVSEITLDGKRIEGSIIPPCADGEHIVEVTL